MPCGKVGDPSCCRKGSIDARRNFPGLVQLLAWQYFSGAHGAANLRQEMWVPLVVKEMLVHGPQLCPRTQRARRERGSCREPIGDWQETR